MILEIIGLIIVTGTLGWSALIGLACAAFNDIGGNGSKFGVAGALAWCAGSVYLIYWVWANYSPFTVVVAP